MHGLDIIKARNNAVPPNTPLQARPLADGNVYTVVMTEYDAKDEHVKDHVVEVCVSESKKPVAPRGWITLAMLENSETFYKSVSNFELIVVLEGGCVIAYKPDEA